MVKLILYPQLRRKRQKWVCHEMYEAPIRADDGTVPNDVYIIGHDPYAINTDQGW